MQPVIKAMTNHHIDTTTLLEYSTGALQEPVAVLTATHLALCPDCRQTSEMLDHAGGGLLEAANEATIDPGTRDAVFAALDDDGDESATASPAPALDLMIPVPLRNYLQGRVDTLEFRRIAPGLEAIDLLEDHEGYTTRLLRIAAGKGMPMHTHTGDEMTLVLDGGFSDESGSYHRGDVAIADGTVEHRPVADPGVDCVCLTVSAAPVRLTGLFGRMLNPFVKF